ncbi:unnamed protein product, partial [Iphiclides podalirius]
MTFRPEAFTWELVSERANVNLISMCRGGSSVGAGRFIILLVMGRIKAVREDLISERRGAGEFEAIAAFVSPQAALVLCLC